MPELAGYAYPQSANEVMELSRAESSVDWATQAQELVRRSKRLLQSTPQALPRPISARSPRLGDRLRNWAGIGVSHGTKLRAKLETSFAEMSGHRRPWDAVSRSAEQRPQAILRRAEQAHFQYARHAPNAGPALGNSVQRLAAAHEFASTFGLHARVLELQVLEQRHDLLEQRLRHSMVQFEAANAEGNPVLANALRALMAHRERQLDLSAQLQGVAVSAAGPAQPQVQAELRTARRRATSAEAHLISTLAQDTRNHSRARLRRDKLMLQVVRAHGEAVAALEDLRLIRSSTEAKAARLGATDGRHLVGMRSDTVSGSSDDDWRQLESRAREAWDRLLAAKPEEGKERAIPKALQMQILNEALQATVPDGRAKGGASRAAGMADALGALLRGAGELLPSPAQAAAPVDPVGPLMRLLSTVPCGIEIACAMAQGVPDSQRRAFAQHAAVFWRAHSALANLEDSPDSAADREFLQGAQRSARSRALAASQGTVAEPGPAQDQVAYHAVRNGLLSIAPGSRFREIDDVLAGAADALNAELAPPPSAPQPGPEEARREWGWMPRLRGRRGTPAEEAGSANGSSRAPVNATTLQQLNTLLAAGGKPALPLGSIAEEAASRPLEALIHQSGPREKYHLSSRTGQGFAVPPIKIGLQTGVLGLLDISLAPLTGLGWERRRTDTLGVEAPSWGVTLQVSNEQATVYDSGSTSIGAGIGLSAIARATGIASVKPRQQAVSITSAVDLRSIREKDPAGLWMTDRVNERAEILLRALMSRSRLSDRQRGPYEGALASILLADEDVQVAQSVRSATSHASASGVGLSISGRLGKNGIQEEGRWGASLQIKKSWGRRTEVREEDGHTGVAARESASQSFDRTTIGLFRGLMGSNSLAETEADGRTRLPVILGGMGLDWTPFDKTTKVGAVRFPIGEHMGGSLDRAESAPDRLIAELQTHTEAWLTRAMDVLPSPVGTEAEPTQAQKLQAAERMLERCVEALKLCPEQTVQYGVKYELNPSLTGWIDGLEALRTLGLATGNQDLCDDAVKAASEILHSHVAWMPKTVSARPSGSVSSGTQVQLGVTAGRGNAVAASFSHINFPR